MYRRKSFDQFFAAAAVGALFVCRWHTAPFSKVCGFQRQRLWPLSVEGGIYLPSQAQEGRRKRPGDGFVVGNPRRGFPFD